MSGSTLIVAINALLLKRTKLTGIQKRDKAATQTQSSEAAPAAEIKTPVPAITTQ